MNPPAPDRGLTVLAIVAVAAALLVGLAIAGSGACW